jgi:hypothetical protein
MYGLDNPSRYTDPSGHYSVSELYGLDFLGSWAAVDRKAAEAAAEIIGYRLTKALLPNYYGHEHNSIHEEARIFRAVYGIKNNQPMILDFQGLSCSECRPKACQDAKIWEDRIYIDENGKVHYENIPGTDETCACKPKGGVTISEREIRVASLWPNYTSEGSYWQNIRKINNMIHEFGHAFNLRAGRKPQSAVASYSEEIYVDGKAYLFKMNERPDGFYTDEHGSMTWVQSIQDATTGEASPGSEVFADMFLGWVYGKWASDPYGDARSRFMNGRMSGWVRTAISKP